MAKKLYLKVSRPDVDKHKYYIADKSTAIGELDAVFDYDETGAIVVFELIEMSEAEYNTLPEFTGW